MIKKLIILLLNVSVVVLITTTHILSSEHTLSGTATHYGCGWNGRIGASGITVNCHDPIAAHKTLPFGTIVLVTNDDKNSAQYGDSTVVVIFDRGPYGKGRVIDMMPYSLWQITKHGAGGVKVRLRVIPLGYTCNTYKCLSKKLGVKRITYDVLREMLIESDESKNGD